MDERAARESVDEILDRIINWGGIAAREAEQIVESEWHRQNPVDPITDILRARDTILNQARYRPGPF